MYFSVFESVKIWLGADQKGHHPIQAAISGATATLSHDLCLTPFDTVKQRMQLGYYNNIGHCIRTILLKEGVRSLYISLPTTLVMNLPFGCIMVAVNESSRKVLNPTGKYNLSSTLVSGAVAGAVAAVFTNPLDIVKTRLQTQSLAPLQRSAEPCLTNTVCAPFNNQSLLTQKVSTSTICQCYRSL